MAYYYEQRLPALSDVLPADILNSGRFSQFAPYSTGPQVKQESFENGLKAGAYYGSASSSPSSAYSDASSPWSHGERTPSLSPSPNLVHSQLPQQQQTQQYPHYNYPVAGSSSSTQYSHGNVWISSVATAAQRQPQQQQQQQLPTQYSDLIWMPANMDVQSNTTSTTTRRPSHTTSQTFNDHARRGVVIECPPAKAHGVAHIAPGANNPQVYMGNEAAAFISRVAHLPEQQRGKLRFFRFTQGHAV